MSAVTLRNGVEEVLREHVSEIQHIEVMPNDPGPTIIPLEAIGVQPKQADWIKGPTLTDISANRPYWMADCSRYRQPPGAGLGRSAQTRPAPRSDSWSGLA